MVILCPTYQRATYEWERSLRRYGEWVEKANRHGLEVRLKDGYVVVFVPESEEKRRLLGFRSDMIYVDEFDWGKYEQSTEKISKERK